MRHISSITRVFVLAVAVTNVSAAGAKHRFTVVDDIEMSHLGSWYNTTKIPPITFSPDDQYFMVYSERGSVTEDRPEATIRIYRTYEVDQSISSGTAKNSPSPLWQFNVATFKYSPIVEMPKWLADSSGIAFLAKTEAGGSQILLADLRTKTLSLLVEEACPIRSFDIRDKRHFVYAIASPEISQRLAEESRATAIVGTGRLLFDLIFPSVGLEDLSDLWAVVDGKRYQVKNGSSERPINLYTLGESVLSLSPDGQSVITAIAKDVVPADWALRYPPSRPDRRLRSGTQDIRSLSGSSYVSEYVLVNLIDGESRSITNTPIGVTEAYLGNVSADWSRSGEFIVLSDTFLPVNNQVKSDVKTRPCVVILDLKRDRATCVYRFKNDKEAGISSEAGGGAKFITSAHFVEGDPKRIALNFLAYDGSDGTDVYTSSSDESWHVCASFKGSQDKERSITIAVREAFDKPQVVIASNPNDPIDHVILDPNPQFADIMWGDTSIYRWKDSAGRQWLGGLYKPPDFVAGKRYPLVIQNHGFGRGLFRPGGIYPTAFAAQELASAGILVLQSCDCAGTIDSGEGPATAAGYEAAVRQLVADGLVDPDKVGMIGFSRTCYYVLEAITRGIVRIRAASITDGIDEGYLQYLESVTSVGNPVTDEMERLIGTAPFGPGLKQWVKRSPEFNMENVTTPLLVVALGRESALEMWEPYAILRQLNRPVEFVILNHREHLLSNPRSRLISQGGTVDWFRFWLTGEEDHDQSKADQYTRWRLLKTQEREVGSGLSAVR